MQPYVIKQGDYLTLLAHQYGFDADAVWNDPANDDLRALRPNTNILWPTDVLYIPNQAKRPITDGHNLAIGQTNTFASDVPTVPITIAFQEPSLATQSFTIPELPGLTGLSTGGDGTASLSVPVNIGSFTIVFTQSNTTIRFDVGGLDPVDTLSGVFHRLKNLGFIDVDASFDPADLRGIRSALRAFVEAHSSSNPSSAAVPAEPDDAQSPSDAEGVSAGSVDQSGPPDGVSAASDDATADSDGQPSVPLCWADVDNAGLGDDGKLEDPPARLLLEAHGC